MGITTCGRNNKRSKTGARYVQSHKKKKYNMGRQPANTKIGEERVREVRVRGGNIKQRALRLNNGEFKFISTDYVSEAAISSVIYHPSSNELMRTNTLTKGAVVRIDASPFVEEVGKVERAKQDRPLQDLLAKGHLYAIITSRPGQCGRADGYILQGEELEFFQSKLKKVDK